MGNKKHTPEEQKTLLQTIRARLEFDEREDIKAAFDSNKDFKICERTQGKFVTYFTPNYTDDIKKERWKARIDEFGIDVIRDDDSAFGICNLGTRKSLEYANYPLEYAEANAKLIACAPELLQALKEIIELPQTIGHAYQMQDIARKAIQKAEGNEDTK